MTSPQLHQAAQQAVEALTLIMPLAKGYAAQHNVAVNSEIIAHAADVREALESALQQQEVPSEPVARKPGWEFNDGWQFFVSYMIDHCEGETVSEEALGRWASAFLRDPIYNGSALAASPSTTRQQEADEPYDAPIEKATTHRYPHGRRAAQRSAGEAEYLSWHVESTRQQEAGEFGGLLQEIDCAAAPSAPANERTGGDGVPLYQHFEDSPTYEAMNRERIAPSPLPALPGQTTADGGKESEQ